MKLVRIATALLLVASPLEAQRPAPRDSRSDSVDRYVAAAMSRGRIPGVSVVVVQSGRVVKSRGYGTANRELDVPVTAGTVFALFSVTKAYTATAIARLADEGRLSLDDTVGALLPDLPQAWRGIRVHQLLSHTSGLPDVVADPNRATWIAETRAEALTRLAAVPVQAAPGQTWSYNQTNYMLLGMIVERHGGAAFEQYVRERLLAPIRLRRTTFGDSRDVVPGRATWYTRLQWTPAGPVPSNDVRHVWVTYPDFTRAAASLNATAGEVAAFVEAVAAGRVVSHATRDRMWTATRLGDGSTFRMDGTLGAGLGWLVDDRPGHRSAGAIGGGSVAFRHFIDDRLTVVVLTNLQGAGPDGLVSGIAAIYVPQLASPR